MNSERHAVEVQLPVLGIIGHETTTHGWNLIGSDVVLKARRFLIIFVCLFVCVRACAYVRVCVCVFVCEIIYIFKQR